jgi:hypothetical protein
MLECLLETTDKETCPAKKAGQNLVAYLENLCCHDRSLHPLWNSLSG